ncbi:hypothetical protein [Synechococcus sp. HK01-R]|uniref:hypothetical protein n=1 Tax=Synechococcus sp. HK01-R TaxID=2751171 RepID=UPI0016241DC3|nr:hypothetical protein [Synechococcus sp. HK01-R]QNG26092.1 hypothetical protein H0O21_07170 [Synechococcus sp. HK01-R]
MSQCDDAFQEIQRLEQERRKIEDQLIRAREALDPEQRIDPARVFVFQDKATGASVEVQFDQIWDALRRTDSPAMQAWADRALGARERPVGSEGQFQNLKQLVDRIGIEDANQMARLVQTITGSWEEMNPKDWNAVTAINNKETFAQRLADSFAEANIRLDTDKISRGVAENVAPFLTILNRQTKLQVFSDVTRKTLIEKVRAIREHIEQTGTPATQELKWALVDAGAKAIFAQRSAALSRRVSGQLLQQLQNNSMVAPAIAGRLFREELEREAGKLFVPTAGDLIGENTVLGKVAEASARGVDGVEDLKQLEITLEAEGADPFAPSLDDDFAYNWRRQARAYYKDSQLFNLNTQLLNNYLANKLVFVAEGFRKAFENGVKLRPFGTSFLRGIFDLDNTIKGARIAAEAGFIAQDVIRQSWKDSFRDAFIEGRTPFAGNPDQLGTQGAIPIDQQYEIAYRVLYGDEGRPTMKDADGNDVPIEMPSKVQKLRAAITQGLDPDARYWPMDMRDKAFVGLKLLGNHLIEKQTGMKLPVTSALQMMAAVDHRAGLKTFMTARANELLLRSANEMPLLSWAERKAWVREQLEDQLYQATPTAQNIKDFRRQHDLSPEEFSDEDIASALAYQAEIGKPVLASPEQQEAFALSQYARMQQKPDGWLGKLDQGIMGAREDRYVDSFFPYWRSPMGQALWDMKQARPPIIETAKVIFGKNPTTEQIAKVTGSWYTWLGMLSMWGVLESQGLVEGNGPTDPKERAEWLAAGHKPNSVFGIPYNLGGLPILNTLFLYSDLWNTFVSGEYSHYDRKNAFMGLAQVAIGQLMRQTGWRQFQMLGDTLMSQSEGQWARFMGFLVNGQVNPASGVTRQVERLTGLTNQDLMQPRALTLEDRYWQDQIGDDDPLKKLEENLRNFAYYSVPSVSFLMGQPLKEEDYMGRKVQRPEGIFKGEWPLGFPAHWDNRVYATLDRLNLLQPPAPLMSGRLGGVLMDEPLEKEFNHYTGNTKGGVISDHPLFSRRLSVRLSAVEGELDRGEGRRYEVKTTVPVDLQPLLDRLTKGKTLYEALNGLFTSASWKQWEADPRFSTNPKLNDRPRSQQLELPGPRAVKILHDYYAQLATEKVELSQSPGAAQWRQERDARNALTTPDQVERDATELERMVR